MTETDNQTIDHDGLFKEVIKHNYWDFLKLFYRRSGFKAYPFRGTSS